MYRFLAILFLAVGIAALTLFFWGNGLPFAIGPVGLLAPEILAVSGVTSVFLGVLLFAYAGIRSELRQIRRSLDRITPPAVATRKITDTSADYPL